MSKYDLHSDLTNTKLCPSQQREPNVEVNNPTGGLLEKTNTSIIFLLRKRLKDAFDKRDKDQLELLIGEIGIEYKQTGKITRQQYNDLFDYYETLEEKI